MMSIIPCTLLKPLPLKSKTKTYLLLVAVLGIWGAIAYKIISGMSPTITEVKRDDFNMVFKPKTTTKVDTFTIQNLDKDPFLGTLTTKRKSSTTKRKAPIKKQGSPMPIISYSGSVKRQNGSNRVFVVNINNKQYLLNKGQVADSVQLVKGNENAIIVRYNNRNKTINRQ